MPAEAGFPTRPLAQGHPQPVHTKVHFLETAWVPGTATLQLEGLNIGRRLVFSFKERRKSLQKYSVPNHFLFLGLPKSSLSLLKKKKSMIKEKGQGKQLSGLSTCLVSLGDPKFDPQGPKRVVGVGVRVGGCACNPRI